MRTSRHRLHAPATAAVTLSLVGALALAACTTEASPKTSSPAETTTSSTEPTPEPTPEPSPDGPQVFDAGTASPGNPKTVTGTGPASINFSIEPMAVVYQFTCGDCTGPVDVNLADPAMPMWRATGPVDGAWKSSPSGPIATSNTIDVDVDGTWTMTITENNALSPTSGPQSGHGSGVIFLDQAATQLDYTFTAFDEKDNAAIFAYNDLTHETAAEWIGGTTSGTLDITLPAIIFVDADGDWTITPR